MSKKDKDSGWFEFILELISNIIEEFFNLCKKEFGEDTWNTFVTIGNYFSEAKLNKYEYLELLEKLKGETLC
jgi:hypothetical protein